MLVKYVEERFPTYFVLGGTADGSRVNACSTRRDDIVLATPEEAASLIEDRDKIVSYLASMADAFDKATPGHFSHFWYGSEKPKEDYATLKAQRDELLVLLKSATVDGAWAEGFTSKEYDSDEPEENVFRDKVLSAIAKCGGPL